jgi:hypothetical protein
MKLRPLERTVFWIVPPTVLLVAFAGLCVMTGTVWPWHHVVHEDGSRTLLATVFYVEHAARELLPDALLALAVAGAARYYFPPVLAAGSAQASRWRRRLGLVAAITLVGIVGGTISSAGGRAFIDNLSQLHTRGGAPLVWGAHWRYHLIERFAQMMLAFSATGVVWLLHGKPDADRAKGRFRFYGAALLVFAALTVVFQPTAESFTEPAFLGHQLRELFTHSLVTLPLALGTCLMLARTVTEESRVQGPGSRVQRPGSGAVSPIIVAVAAALVSGTFLLVASLATDAQSHGQAQGLAALLFPHFAEHALGYAFVPALAGWIYLAPAKARGT